MSISPISPIETEPSWQSIASPEPSWQPPPRRVAFNNVIEYYSGGPAPIHKKDEDGIIELGAVSKDKPTSAHEEWTARRRPRKRILCFSKRTCIILVVGLVFVLGAILGGVLATLISKDKAGKKSTPTSSRPTEGVFPTVTHGIPSPTPTPTQTQTPRPS